MTPTELRERRAALSLTQGELARHLGVHRVTVARWECGRPMPVLLKAALQALTIELLIQRGYLKEQGT